MLTVLLLHLLTHWQWTCHPPGVHALQTWQHSCPTIYVGK